MRTFSFLVTDDVIQPCNQNSHDNETEKGRQYCPVHGIVRSNSFQCEDSKDIGKMDFCTIKSSQHCIEVTNPHKTDLSFEQMSNSWRHSASSFSSPDPAETKTYYNFVTISKSDRELLEINFS